MAYDDTVGDVRAREAAALQKQGNALAAQAPGRGIVSSMSQLGGMLGGQVMEAAGQYTPEEQKAKTINALMAEAGGPPKTQEEADTLATKIHQAGYAKDAAGMMKHFQSQRQGEFKTEEMKLKNEATKSTPAWSKLWVTEKEPAAVKEWAGRMLKGKIKDEELASVRNMSDITLVLNRLVEGGMKPSSANRLAASLAAELKQGKSNYLLLNKGLMPDAADDTRTRDLNSITGYDRGNGVRVGPTATKPITPTVAPIEQPIYGA